MEKRERLFEVSCPAHEVGEAEEWCCSFWGGCISLPILNTYGSEEIERAVLGDACKRGERMEKGTRALDVMKDTMRVISVSLVTLLACGVTMVNRLGCLKARQGRDVCGHGLEDGGDGGTSIGVGDEEARPQAGEDYQDDADTADEAGRTGKRAVRMKTQLGTMRLMKG